MPDTVSTYSYLPPRMREYVKFPWILLLLWVGFSCAVIFAPLPAGSSSGSVSGAFDDGRASDGGPAPDGGLLLAVSGNENYSIARVGDALTVAGPHAFNNAHLIETRDGATVRIALLQSDGRPAAQGTFPVAAVPDAVATLNDSAGAVRFRVKVKDEGFSILSAGGDQLFRVKLKEDKFNILKGNDERILHGKAKGSSLVVKNESDSVVGYINLPGNLSLSKQFDLGARASVPLPLEYRFLLIGYALSTR